MSHTETSAFTEHPLIPGSCPQRELHFQNYPSMGSTWELDTGFHRPFHTQSMIQYSSRVFCRGGDCFSIMGQMPLNFKGQLLKIIVAKGLAARMYDSFWFQRNSSTEDFQIMMRGCKAEAWTLASYAFPYLPVDNGYASLWGTPTWNLQLGKISPQRFCLITIPVSSEG